MIKVVDKELIRRLRYVQGWSERRIARELSFGRETVRKYLREEPGEAPRYHRRRDRAKPVLGEMLPLIEQWLTEDEQRPRKQRRTARRIWQQLQEEYGFRGAESSVRRVVGQFRGRQREVFIPLEFGPGERAEVDWGTAQVILAGRLETVHLFCARLRYSGAPFVMAFPCERQEAFFAGHVAAFAFWDGVPRLVVYDNLTTAVRRVLEGRRRAEQDAFVGLRTHYLYEAVFCQPAAGHEKGSVENLVGYFRRRYLTPLLEVSSWEALNEHLRRSCQRDAERTQPGQARTIGELWAEERAQLLPLPPRPFDASRRVAVTATRTAEVVFETNRYSVPVDCAYQPLLVKADVEMVRVYHQTRLVAEHPRCYGQHQRVSDWRHYLPLLARKPGAVPFAAALRRGELAPVYETFRRGLCERSPDGNREFVRLLELCVHHPAPLVTLAVEQAVAAGAYHVAAVEQLLGQVLTPRVVHPPLDPARYPELGDLATVRPEPVALAAYNQLLAGARSVAPVAEVS